MQRMEYYSALENLKHILLSDKKPSWKSFNLHDSNYTAFWRRQNYSGKKNNNNNKKIITARDSLGRGFVVGGIKRAQRIFRAGKILYDAMMLNTFAQAY